MRVPLGVGAEPTAVAHNKRQAVRRSGRAARDVLDGLALRKELAHCLEAPEGRVGAALGLEAIAIIQSGGHICVGGPHAGGCGDSLLCRAALGVVLPRSFEALKVCVCAAAVCEAVAKARRSPAAAARQRWWRRRWRAGRHVPVVIGTQINRASAALCISWPALSVVLDAMRLETREWRPGFAPRLALARKEAVAVILGGARHRWYRRRWWY